MGFFPEKPEENLFIVHKAITDLSLEETSVDEMTFREGKRNLPPLCTQHSLGWLWMTALARDDT